MVHADGTLMPCPIALVEVQAYVYAARRRLAAIYSALGDDGRAQELMDGAAALKRRFNRDYWVDHQSCYGLAIGGDGQVSEAVTSNAGHALWSGIATTPGARETTKRLLRSDMFSGWGIRTLSSESPRYNPQGYHLGTIWPHDNAIVLAGMKRYGMEREANTLSAALFRAARSFEYCRLPELFGGETISSHLTPVPYPVACRPQAWAAGSFLLITQSLLGLCPDAAANTLHVVHPVLPPYLDWVQLDRVRVGKGEADLLFRRHGSRTSLHVLSVRGGLEVVPRRRWPAHLL
jgi:glycogen debranching enzyme